MVSNRFHCRHVLFLKTNGIHMPEQSVSVAISEWISEFPGFGGGEEEEERSRHCLMNMLKSIRLAKKQGTLPVPVPYHSPHPVTFFLSPLASRLAHDMWLGYVKIAFHFLSSLPLEREDFMSRYVRRYDGGYFQVYELCESSSFRWAVAFDISVLYLLKMERKKVGPARQALNKLSRFPYNEFPFFSWTC